jgi:hypothetical protein
LSITNSQHSTQYVSAHMVSSGKKCEIILHNKGNFFPLQA